MKIFMNFIHIKIRTIFSIFQYSVNTFKYNRAVKIIFSNKQNFRILNFLRGHTYQQIIISFKI